MKFIKLLDAADSYEFYLSVDKVVSVEPAHRDGDYGNTNIMTMDNGCFSVMQTVNQVMNLINSV